MSKASDTNFMGPFQFVFESGYYGGLLTRVVALYACYVVLGMIPYGMITVTGKFFASLSGNSISSFYFAAGLYIAFNLAQRTLEMVGKFLSRLLANEQQLQIQKTFRKGIDQRPERFNAFNRFTDEEKNAREESLKASGKSNDEIEAIIKKAEEDEKGKFGGRATDQSKVFEMVNKISEQVLQSVASITSNIFFLVNIGMTRAALGIFASTVAINSIIIWYALNIIKPLDQEANDNKFAIRTLWQSFTGIKSETKDVSDKLEAKSIVFDTTVKQQVRHDFMVDIFNNCIRYCALPVGIFIAVYDLAGGNFPLTSIVSATGVPLTAAFILAVASPIEKIIQDTSVFAKSYQELYQSAANFGNTDKLLKRGKMDVRHQVTTFNGTKRRESILNHTLYHALFGITMWSTLSTIASLTVAISLSNPAALTTLIPTMATGLIAYIGMQKLHNKKFDDKYDYAINMVFASIFSITTLIIATSNASIFATILRIAPTLLQQVNLTMGIFTTFYTLSSAATVRLKPSEENFKVAMKAVDKANDSIAAASVKKPNSKSSKNVISHRSSGNEANFRIASTI